MMDKKLLSFILLTSFISTLSTSFPSAAKIQTTTKVYVEPPYTNVLVGANFTVDITISQVTNLCSWQAYIYFKKDILEAIGYAEGPFLKSHGTTIFDGNINNNYNSTHGELWMYCLRAWTGYGVDGSGTLANATFNAKRAGTSPLILANTILGNSTAERITHTTENGMVEVGGPDIAILSVIPSKTIMAQNYSMQINVTVENQGDTTENFNVVAYANTSIIQTKNIVLTNGASTTVTFTWNTAGFSKGNYTVSAVADTIPGEIDTADNTLNDGQVMVTVAGDINGDGKVDIKDLVLVIKHFGSYPSSIKPWNPNADINCDGKVDIKDLVLVIKHFGEHYP